MGQILQKEFLDLSLGTALKPLAAKPINTLYSEGGGVKIINVAYLPIYDPYRCARRRGVNTSPWATTLKKIQSLV